MKKYADNFRILEDLLEFQSEDDYYLLELIGRKKDSVEVTHSQDHFGSYYVTSREMLRKLEPEVKALCQLKHCRAYLNMNPKSKKKTALKLMKSLLSKMENDDYSRLFGAMTSAAGECGAQPGRKLFLLDVDDLTGTREEALKEVYGLVKACKTTVEPDSFILQFVPTVSGFHLLTSPFDCSDFAKKAPEALKHCHAEVKHNSPTLLYIDIDEEAAAAD